MNTIAAADLEALERDIAARIAGAADDAALENERVAALGKKGAVSELLKGLGGMTPDERKVMGPALNGLKERLNQAIAARRAVLRDGELLRRLEEERVDVTLPVRPSGLETGRIHPVSQVIDEITAIFADLGFAIAEGPDIETDYYNFTALNFPEGHPAREMHDTFFFNPKPDGERMLLRTHTSPVQIRTMETQKPPIRVVIPGRTYRFDSDQTHTPMFHQVEGLVLDEEFDGRHAEMGAGGILQGLLRGRPGQDAVPPVLLPLHRAVDGGRYPVRPLGLGDPLRRRRRLAGDPRLRHGPSQRHPPRRPRSDKVQGFAWGMGIDRIAMLKYGMPDLRAFFDADVRWLNHYGFRPLDLPSLARGLSRSQPTFVVDVELRSEPTADSMRASPVHRQGRLDESRRASASACGEPGMVGDSVVRSAATAAGT